MFNKKSLNAEEHPGHISSNKEASKRERKYPTCSKDWHQLGQNCYHFSKNHTFWKECDGYCTNLNSTFIKVDTTDEMDFFMKLVKMQYSPYQKVFISLYYNSTQSKWFLFDGTDFTKSSFKIGELAGTGYKCTYIMDDHVRADECQNYGYCTCKKTIY
ncbi:C-type lectin domain family 1 member A-like [Talpa occidentalis]|uniref:C-type lectin domain family 1 member A-like n=1 Tax=Talpa occidentalis TaxID=50954 RepID=UPI0023FA0324|nr:C-type lectin domain family 1 member A-like [Talpa occidentalis]